MGRTRGELLDSMTAAEYTLWVAHDLMDQQEREKQRKKADADAKAARARSRPRRR